MQQLLLFIVTAWLHKLDQNNFLQTAPKIFGGKIMTHLLLFVSKKADNFDEVLANIKESSKKFKGKVSFNNVIFTVGFKKELILGICFRYLNVIIIIIAVCNLYLL